MIGAKKAKNMTDDSRFDNTPLLPIIFNSVALACSMGKDYSFIKGKNMYRGAGSTGKVLDFVRGLGYTVTPSDEHGVMGIVVYWGFEDEKL